MGYSPIQTAKNPGIIRRSEVISALSYALDLPEGQPAGHSLRSCVFGMHLAHEIGLPPAQQSDLFYALLMKDAGCSANASKMMHLMGSDDIVAKRDVCATDWTRLGWESVMYALSHVQPGAPFLKRMQALFSMALNRERNGRELVQIRCERGASIARRIGLTENSALAIFSVDELWNGAGHPNGLRGTEIPLLSRIMNLAQTLDIFYFSRGESAALEVANERKGRWFDPDLVRAFRSLAKGRKLWEDLGNPDLSAMSFAPSEDFMPAGEATIDNICQAFAEVIDAKSPFTYQHSTGVAAAAVRIGEILGLQPADLTLLRRAALLHDIGKLSVSNTILDKPGKLSDREWGVVRAHPSHSFEILNRVPGFEEVSKVAACHHEKLNGTGYFRGLRAEALSLPARILAVADIYDALAAKRPYRDALPVETVFQIMRKEAPHAIDQPCFEALCLSKITVEDKCAA